MNIDKIMGPFNRIANACEDMADLLRTSKASVYKRGQRDMKERCARMAEATAGGIHGTRVLNPESVLLRLAMAMRGAHPAEFVSVEEREAVGT